MRKYDVRFCSCGRVHFIENERIEKAIENEKEVLVVCNHCGNAFIIGADRTHDEYIGDCYSMYSIFQKDITIEDTSKIDSIIFTNGEQIRMMTGGEATYHCNGFIDWDTPKQPINITDEEWEKRKTTVDTQSTINWIKDEEKLDAMSGYGVEIDWTGTKYDRFNK